MIVGEKLTIMTGNPVHDLTPLPNILDKLPERYPQIPQE